MIPGLGRIEVHDRAARVGRNPQTGETIQIPAKRVPKFRPFLPLRKAADGGFGK